MTKLQMAIRYFSILIASIVLFIGSFHFLPEYAFALILIFGTIHYFEVIYSIAEEGIIPTIESGFKKAKSFVGKFISIEINDIDNSPVVQGSVA